jgi:hypothetical protein
MGAALLTSNKISMPYFAANDFILSYMHERTVYVCIICLKIKPGGAAVAQAAASKMDIIDFMS